jgi:hypothetical protein
VFYIVPNWTSVTADVNFQYVNAGYNTREYYLYQSTLSNQTLDLTLYDSNSTLASGIVFTVKDNVLNPVDDVYIYVQRFYPSSNSWTTVAMGKTDENGQDIIYLYPNTQFYKFILIRDGEIIKTIDPMKISASTVTFYVNLFAGSIKIFSQLEDIDYIVSYNSTSNSISATLISPAGLFDTYCMKVDKVTAVSQFEECNSCNSGTAIVLTCSLSSNISYYVINIFGLGSFGNLYSGYLDLTQGSASTLGSFGLYLTLIVVLVIAFTGLINPTISVIASVLGIVGSAMIGILSIPYAIIMSLSAVAVIVIWRMRT